MTGLVLLKKLAKHKYRKHNFVIINLHNTFCQLTKHILSLSVSLTLSLSLSFSFSFYYYLSPPPTFKLEDNNDRAGLWPHWQIFFYVLISYLTVSPNSTCKYVLFIQTRQLTVENQLEVISWLNISQMLIKSGFSVKSRLAYPDNNIFWEEDK